MTRKVRDRSGRHYKDAHPTASKLKAYPPGFRALCTPPPSLGHSAYDQKEPQIRMRQDRYFGPLLNRRARTQKTIPTLNVPLSPHLAVLSDVRLSSSSAMRLMECCVKCPPSRRRRGTADGLSHIPRWFMFFCSAAPHLRPRPRATHFRRACCRRDEMNASSECFALCPLRRASLTLVRPVP